MTLKEFFDSKEVIAIHCNTKEKATILLNAFHKLGKTWLSGTSYLKDCFWEYYRSNTCYGNDNRFCNISSHYIIIEFEDIDLGETQ